MIDYIFTIGCFDKLHKGHINLLETIRKNSKKFIIGLHDNNSISKIKNITNIDPYDIRKKNLEKYADDIFIIDNVDPTQAIKEYITNNFNEDNSYIYIGPSNTNTKVIKNDYNKELYFFHNFKDKFKYSYQNGNIIITRTDSTGGWGQNLIAYKYNWCFCRADDNKNFPSIDYVKTLMPIKFLPYTNTISSTNLRNYRSNKIGLMNFLLQKTVDILNKHNIPYYLDCGTLLGCVRENSIMEKDTDVDITIHLSYWQKLNNIDFNKYDLIKTRTLSGFPDKIDGNMISVKTKFSNLYCDIYTNPAFPKLETKILNGIEYNIPENSDLYLQQLYGNWKIPSRRHADTQFHRGKGLVNSQYKKYWDQNYKIYNCIF